MRKMFLAMVLVFVIVLSVPAFASDVDIDHSPGAVGFGGTHTGDVTTFSPSATGGSVGPITNTQQQGLLNNNTGGTYLSPSATGGTGIGIGGSVKDSGNSTNLIGNGIGNFSPSAKATIEKGAVQNANTNTFNPTNTNNNTVKTDIKNTNTNLNTNLNINDVKNTNSNVIERGAVQNKNSNKQSQDQAQKQQQGQVQGQKQNNEQVIAPIQDTDILIEAPKQNLLGLPSQSVPELNFGNGKMLDATDKMPNFALYGIKKLGSEAISQVLSVNANIKFKNLYKAVLSDAAGIANGGKKTLSDVRYQIIRAEAQKSWNTGGNLGGGGSGLASSGLGGGSGAGSLIPTWGGTKADDLFTVIFVKIVI